MQVKSRKIYTQLCQDYRNIYFLWWGQSQEKWVSLSILGGGDIQKVRLLEISNFRPPSPFFVPVCFTCTPSPHQPTFTLVSYPPHTHIHPPNKISATFMDFRMKNRRVKRQKRIFFFVNSTEKTNIFYTVVCTIAIKLFTKNYKKFIKKRFMKKNCLHLFNKKAPLFAG